MGEKVAVPLEVKVGEGVPEALFVNVGTELDEKAEDAVGEEVKVGLGEAEKVGKVEAVGVKERVAVVVVQLVVEGVEEEV